MGTWGAEDANRNRRGQVERDLRRAELQRLDIKAAAKAAGRGRRTV